MKANLLFILLIIVVFCGIVKGQEPETDEALTVSIPEKIKQQIVSRILIFKFKPLKRQKIIYLSKKGIYASWLPQISNIEFRLLSDEEIEDLGKNVYFFTDPKLDDKIYNIGLGYGDPNCDYSGDSWDFRIANTKVRLWYGGRFGGGCGGEREFSSPGELNSYPNELEGYKFFDRGKLKGLKLTVSTREDVEKNFGSDCDGDCDYDDNWRINFDYFGSISKETTIGEKRIRYVAKPELIGKISSISISPKKRLDFTKVRFPRQFNTFEGFSVGHNYDINGRMTAAAGTSYKTYLDRYGLSYEIYQSSYTVGEAEKDEWRKGDLIFISYSIPEKIEETMFIEEQ